MINLIFPQYFFLYVLLAITISILLSPLLIFLAKRVNLVDIPGKSAHKIHTHPTPLAGGTVIMVSLVLLISIFGLWEELFVRSLLLSAGVVYVFGLLDDARGLSALPKLIGQTVAGILLITSGVSVHFIESLQLSFLSPIMMRALDMAITLFWLIGITNAMNMIDSMDGLAAGLSAITFIFFLPVTIASGQVYLTAISVILLGICMGVYFFNITPAQLFLGDSGAQTLGFIVAAIAMAYTPVGLPPATSWFVPILLLAIPIFDTTLVTVSRIRRKLPFYKANRDHTYHRLVALGLSPLRAVMAVHLVAILIDCLAFVALSLSALLANILFGTILLAGVIVIILLEKRLYPNQPSTITDL
jgi:UDP-GlcNAc:undecaprenyl-phosphate/decaprenyl-phosphate GlcNAc-1-phosphate transferase